MQIRSIPDSAFADLKEQVQQFQAKLTADQEMAMVAGGSGYTIYAHRISMDGQMIVAEGTDEQDRPASLIQHYTQVSLVLIAIDKRHEQARRIGF